MLLWVVCCSPAASARCCGFWSTARSPAGGGSLPFGTLAVNLSGAALARLADGLALSREVALLADTAFVGSYTTFSTWMLETQRLGEERQVRDALANVVVSLVLGLAAACSANGSRVDCETSRASS